MFAVLLTFGQKSYVPKANAAQVKLEGKSLKGYKTNFDFTWEEVRRGWWEYAREFGAPLNMKTYYKVTIPSETTDGNIDLEIFTQSTEVKGGTDFFLGLENEKFKEQAFSLILDFKKKFYIKDLVERIEEKQEKADDLSDAYRDSVIEETKQSLLNQIETIEGEVEILKRRIKEIENS